jgi:hypothetical protein
MPNKAFDDLRERLLVAGVAPRHVRRYLSELGDHLADLTAEERRDGRSPADAEAAALSRLGNIDQLANAMIDQPQFQSWSARAPWAMFGVAPILFLAAAYFLACLYLWLGWTIFKPAADTPFGGPVGPMYGLANMYFQAGKFYYIAAPMLTGWAIALVAARQRLLNWLWPTLALILIAWMGTTAQIQASRSAVHRGLGHISMSFFALGSSQSVSSELPYALAIFSLGVLPYLIWRLQRLVSA